LLEKVQRRFTKLIMGMKGKSYEERLQKLNFWSLEERRNRQDLIEVFKICKGFSRIRPEELFQFDDRGKGTRGHSLKLVKVRRTRDSRRHYFLFFIDLSKDGTSWARRQSMQPASTPLKVN